MRRLIIEEKGTEEGIFTISGEDARHIIRVLRKGPGDELEVSLSTGDAATAVIVSTDGGILTLRVKGCLGTFSEPLKEYVLMQALPKGQKMDFIIEKCTEMGFSDFIPVVSARSVVREASGGKMSRWQKKAHEAAQQSGRMKVPVLREVSDFGEAVSKEAKRGSLLLMFWEEEDKIGLPSVEAMVRGSSRICLIIGPEGGFDLKEVEHVMALGGYTLTLGPRILRTETAPVAAGAAVMYIAGDLGPQGI